MPKRNSHDVKLCYAWQETEDGIYHAFELLDAEADIDHDAVAGKLAGLLGTTPDDGRFDWSSMPVSLPEGTVDRIRAETATNPGMEGPAVPGSCHGGRTYIVTETCPHCGNEIEMRWDTDAMGFKASCPVCGERLMLCDECVHAGGPCDYDGQADTCRRNRKEKT